MIKKISILIIFIIAHLLILVGCQSKNMVGDLKHKIIIDKLKDSNIMASIFYKGTFLDGERIRPFTWRNKQIFKDDAKYEMTYANTNPVKPLEKIRAKFNLTAKQLDDQGQIYFHGNTDKYELFIYDSHRERQYEWKLFFLTGNDVKKIIVKRQFQKESLDSFQIAKDAVYLYVTEMGDNDSDIVVYKIDSLNYNISRIKVPLKLFTGVNEIIKRLDKIFIDNDILIISTSEFNGESGDRGVILKYDLKTQTPKTTFVDYNIDKTFPYKEGYLILGSEKGTYKPFLKYYDEDFNLIKTNPINVRSEHGIIVVDDITYLYQIHEGKLYGAMRIDGKAIYYLITIDAETGEVLYLEELDHTDYDYTLWEVRYQINKNGKYVNLSSF